MTQRFLYLAAADNGAYKIGWSRKPAGRVSTLATGSCLTIDLVHQIKTEHATWLEAHLHRKFESKRIRGEWFRLDAADVEYICSLTPNEISDLRRRTPKHVVPRKPAYTVYARIDPKLGKALEAYIEDTKPKPTVTSVLELAVERYLESVGYWPQKAKDESE